MATLELSTSKWVRAYLFDPLSCPYVQGLKTGLESGSAFQLMDNTLRVYIHFGKRYNIFFVLIHTLILKVIIYI